MDFIGYSKRILRDFFTICSCIFIGASVFILAFLKETSVDVSLLWQIIVVSLATSFLSIVYCSERELSKRAYLIRSAVHYVLVNLVLFLSVYFFDWFKLGKASTIITFVVLVLIVYILVHISIYFMDNIKAKNLNKMLDEYKKRRGEEIE